MTTAQIRQAILQILADVAPHALPLSQLFAAINRQVRPPIADPRSLHEHMSALLDMRYVDFLADEMDPNDGDLNRWLIKEAGQSYLLR